MPWKATIAGALFACAVLSACQGPGGSSSGGGSSSTAPASGPASPTSIQQCQAITASPAATLTVATPAAPSTSGTIQGSLVLVPEGTHSLGVYLRNPWTGALVDRGYVPTGQTPSAAAVSQGQYVYVANSTDGTISAYSWQSSTNELVALGPAITGGPGVSSLAVVGQFLYALNTNNTIGIFSIGNAGALTIFSSVNTQALMSVVAGANGSLYGLESNGIVTYSGAGNGTPKALGATALPGVIAGASNGAGSLYVLTSAAVTAYTADNSGVLSAQDSVALPAGLTATAIAAGNGQINVVGDGSNATEVVTFPLIGGGIACPTSAVLGPSGQANAASVSPGGHYVYVTNTTMDDLSAYTATTSGSDPQLTDIVRTRLAPHAVTALAVKVTISPQMLYVVNQTTNVIAGYTVAPTGVLSGQPSTEPTTCGSCATADVADSGPSAVAIAPNGQNLYASDWAQAGPGDVTAFSIAATDGSLTNSGSTAAGDSPMGVAVDPSNRYLYVANSCYVNDTVPNCQGTIDGYSLTGGMPSAFTSGDPTLVGPASPGSYPMLLTVDPTGRFLYVSQYTAGTIGMFSINPDNGILSATGTGTATAGTGPWTVVVGPMGRHLYVSDSSTAGGVSIYSIDATTGNLTATTTLAIADQPLGLAIGPKGRRLYVATLGGVVDVFTRPNPLATSSSWNATPLPLSGTFTNAYGMAISNNGKALYVVDDCTAPTYNNGTVQELAIPSFSQGLSAANYTLLGSAPTEACTVEAVAGGGLG